MNQQPFTRGKTKTPSRTNLTHRLSSFIGRKKELAQVRQYLAQTRLLTLIGVGGCGKTSLAQQLAAELLSIDAYEGGVWWVELAGLHDPELVPQAVAQALGVRESFEQTTTDSLVDYFADKRLFLVLDNCEHLLVACTQLAEKLLLGSPHLKILATSREPLGLVGETTYLVPSLSLPEPNRPALPSDLSGYDAPALFLERARSVLPSFTGAEQTVPAILQVCQRLDGIPLAIELAAARVNVLTVEQIAERLTGRFALLTASNRAAVLPRHQTLRAAIDWSYDLLSEKERTLFRRLAVFSGGFTLAAAETICAGEDLGRSEILNELSRLVSKSLVVAEVFGQRQARYHLLEMIRQYALNLLRESGEEHTWRDRHCGWFLVLAEEARAQWRGPRQRDVFDQLEIEHDNLRVALEWSKGESSPMGRALRFGSALWRFWEIHGHLREGLGHLTEILSLPSAQARSKARAKALYGAGYLSMMQGAAKSLASSETFIGESLAIARELDEPQLIAFGVYGLGILARFRGDNESAVKQLEESLILFRRLGDRVGMYIALYNLAEVATARGEYDKAQTLHEESLVLKRAQQDEWSIANSLMSLAILARLQGNHQQALERLQEGLMLFQKIGDRTNVAFCLLEFSIFAVLQGQSQLAVQIYAAADRLLEALGYQKDHAFRAETEAQLAMTRSRIGEIRFNAAWKGGEALSLEQAIEQIQGFGLPERDARSQSASADEPLLVPLNERELEILRLIAEGLSNNEIAERLVIALSTVKWHINNLFGKLGVHSRTQAVAQAKELGLL